MYIQYVYMCIFKILYIYINLYVCLFIYLLSFQRVQGLVEYIITYCGCNHHTVSHVCTSYIQPTCLGQILRKSVAFLQVELSLKAEEKNCLDLVEVSCDFYECTDSISQNIVD